MLGRTIKIKRKQFEEFINQVEQISAPKGKNISH